MSSPAAGNLVDQALEEVTLPLRKLYNMRVRRSALDQQDVLALLRIHRRQLNLEYVRERARLFRLLERFEALLAAAQGHG